MSELHRLERKLLFALKGQGMLSVDELIDRTSLPEASVNRAALWLSSKGLATVREESTSLVQLGDEGRRFLREKLPERRLAEAIVKLGGEATLEQAALAAGLDDRETPIAVGWARRKRWIQIRRGRRGTIVRVVNEPEIGHDERLLQAVSGGRVPLKALPRDLERGFELLKNRPQAITSRREAHRHIGLTKKGESLAGQVSEVEEVSQLTPELIQSGKWRSIKLRRYDIQAPVLSHWPGKKQPYRRFLDETKWKLVALGFKEMIGPIVELMFFNCDALYMPQDHPAREIHDIYFVKNPQYGSLDRYKEPLENVKSCHEDGWKTGSRGWGYKFSVREARRLILRSQGTHISARTLANPEIEIPGKYYSIARCYRPDVVDRTHLTEFNQIEGIVVGEDLTFRDLLGVLENFAIEIAGAEKVRFRPDYFPFTEPSVETAAYKKGVGWLEFGGAGIFRPEVTLPWGIDVPVIAWGLGVDRLFMMKTGIDDIRDLFTQDLIWLRRQGLV